MWAARRTVTRSCGAKVIPIAPAVKPISGIDTADHRAASAFDRGSSADPNASIGRLHTSLSERNGSIAEFNGSIEERHASIGERRGSMEESNASIEERNGSIAEHNASIGEQNGGILLFNKAPYRDVGGMKRRLGRVAMGRWGGVGKAGVGEVKAMRARGLPPPDPRFRNNKERPLQRHCDVARACGGGAVGLSCASWCPWCLGGE